MDHLCYFCLVLLCPARLFVDALWSPAEKGCLIVTLSLSNWHPGSGVVLYCNDF